MTAKRIKEIKDIKEGLLSSQDVLINKALNLMESKGDASLIPDVITLWSETDNQQTKKKVESLLFGLKDSKALDVLVAFIQTDVAEDHKWLALNAIWQSGYNAKDHLNTLIGFSFTNSFTNAIDIMTIVDNSEFTDEDDDLIDSNIRKINDFVTSTKSDNQSLLLEIKEILINKKIEG